MQNTIEDFTVRPRRVVYAALLMLAVAPLCILALFHRDIEVMMGTPAWFASAILLSLLIGLLSTYLIDPKPLMQVTIHGISFPRLINDPIPWTSVEQISAKSVRGPLGEHRENLIIRFRAPRHVDWRTARHRQTVGDVPQAAISIEIGFQWPMRAEDVKAKLLRAASSLSFHGEVMTVQSSPVRFRRAAIGGAVASLAIFAMAIVQFTNVGLPRVFAEGLAQYDAGNIQAALPLLEADARAGDGASSYALGTLYLNGDGVERNLSLSTAWFKRGAQSGYPGAAFRYGEALRLGLGTPADTTRAIDWLSSAADDGVAEAAYSLARMYRLGDGVRRDYETAIHWLHVAADAGSAAAEHDLGRLYHDGIAVPRDEAVAMRWYLVAAERGYQPARYDLARLLLDGDAEMRELGMAHLHAAAEAGHPAAQRRLARHYLSGQEVIRDPITAYQWITLATRSWPAATRTDVILERVRIAEHLSPQELETAKQRIRAWRPRRL